MSSPSNPLRAGPMENGELFARAIAFVLEQEGGYADNPKDPGGETKYGISKRSYPELDIPSLTREDAIAIYRRDFWDAHHFGALPPALALACFDAGVNQGPVRAIRWLQHALQVEQDGRIGPETIDHASQAPLAPTLLRILVQRGVAYGLTPNFGTWGHTWMRRLLDCYRTCLELTA